MSRARPSSVAPSRGTVSIVLPAPQDGDALGDLEDLVQLVGDEDDRLSLGLERLDDLEELARLLRREDCGRLVEDEDLGAAVERLQDLDPLLHADADRLDAGVGPDREAEPLGELADALLRLALVDERALRRLSGEDDVLRHGHHRDEHEVLVHHADPRVDRLARRVDAQRFAVQPKLALVRVVEPVEDVHQRGLAGAVLSEKCVHFALAQVEVDPVVRHHSREALGDPLELEKRRFRHGRGKCKGRDEPAPYGNVPSSPCPGCRAPRPGSSACTPRRCRGRPAGLPSSPCRARRRPRRGRTSSLRHL